jgi:hypothetical protein
MRLIACLHRPSFDLQALRRLAGPLTLVIALEEAAVGAVFGRAIPDARARRRRRQGSG